MGWVGREEVTEHSFLLAFLRYKSPPPKPMEPADREELRKRKAPRNAKESPKRGGEKMEPTC